MASPAPAVDAVSRVLLLASVVAPVAAQQSGLCADKYSDCTHSHCCMDSSYQCYEKNAWFAECMLSCRVGNHSEDPEGFRTPWSCNIRSPFAYTGPRKTSEALDACKTLNGMKLEPGLPRRSPVAPMIHCFAVVAPGTYEPAMVAMQFRQGLGIFSCDAHTVVSNVTAEALFEDKLAASRIRVLPVDTDLWVRLQEGPAHWDPASRSWQHTEKHLLNSPVFIKVWGRLFEDGTYNMYDWTLKLDVDAFPMASRIKSLLMPHTSYPSRPLYVLNAAVDVYGNFLHGPVEALSTGAMRAYEHGADRCRREVDFADKGEDWYLGLCLQHLGVPSVRELRLLSDAYAWGSKYVPCDQPFAVFHPLKSAVDWRRCMLQVCPTDLDPWGGEAPAQLDLLIPMFGPHVPVTF